MPSATESWTRPSGTAAEAGAFGVMAGKDSVFLDA
jgi:hypothetical protein